MTDRVGKAAPGVKLRDLIRKEISKQMREVDQISLGVVSDVDDLEVLLDGMTAAVPVAWASASEPVLGDRVVCVALRGGQQWLVTGSVNGGTGLLLPFLPLAGGEMSGDILLPNNIDLVFGNVRATMRHTTDFDDRLVIDSLDAMWFHADAGFAFLVGAANDPAYLMGEKIFYTTPGADTFDHGDFPGMRAVDFEAVGGGGGGGGSPATSAGESSGGGGGGGGEYARARVLVGDLATSETVTVGARGNRGSGGTGGDGGDSSVGSHVVANGGAGGISTAAGSSFGGSFGGLGGSGGTGDLVIGGGDGGPFYRITGATRVSTGNGGNSVLGHGGRGDASDGKGYGGGGGGNSNGASASANFGGWATPGIVIATVLY